MIRPFAQWSARDIETTLRTLKTSRSGLSIDEVKERQSKFGKNELHEHIVAWWTILSRQLTSPFTIILIVVTILSFTFGEIIDGGMVLLFLLINIFLSFFQEYRSEKSVLLLKQLITTKTHVIRENVKTQIESREITLGDIIIIEAGDVVPADLRLLSVTNCTIDESSLTGESIPVQKDTQVSHSENLFTAQNIAFSGTHVLSGMAEGVVIAIGHKTEMGAIALMADASKRVSGFEQSIAAYSQVILRVIFFTLLVVTGLNILLKYDSVNIFSLMFFCIALAISVIPEGLPVVTTLALSQGAIALSKLNVVVKRLSAIEDLGSIEVLCTDKTGTLTENNLKVSETHGFSHSKEKIVYFAAVGASFLGEKKKEPNNSFDLSLWNELTQEYKELIKKTRFKTVIPFDPSRRRSTVIIEQNNSSQLIARGAPELLISFADVSDKHKKELLAWASYQGENGKRVLAVVKKDEISRDFEVKEDNDIKKSKLIGLVAFEDPLKNSSYQAIRQAKALGVQVKILTGDSAEVAKNVAEKIGLINAHQEVMTGEELDQLTLLDKHTAVETHQVFARVTPEQKHTIIHLLQDHKSVGFLGEGINDAPALKTAQVGIVVQGASDIATQSADVVLLANDLAVIVEGIRMGRIIFSNTVKYIKVTLASNFGNFFAVAVASLLTSSLPMLPLQILLLNLLSDFPMISIATDRVSPEELKSPKKYQVHEVVALATVLGVVSSFFDFAFFAVFSRQDPSTLQTYWFIGSVLTELVFIYSIRVHGFFLRSVRPGIIMVILTILAAFLSVFIPFTEYGQSIFGFIQPTVEYLLLVIFIVSLYFVVTELVKLTYYSFSKKAELAIR